MYWLKTFFISVFLISAGCVSAQHNFINHDGETIHYQVFGSGDPVLLINGGPGMSSEGFTDLAKRLAVKNQVILYDQRGTGLSHIPVINSRSMTMKLLVDDIEILREHLKINEWVVMGHSFGGMLAYFYATVYPQRVKAMIQSSSGGMDLTLLNSLDITAALTQNQRDSLAYYTQKIREGDSSFQTQYNRGKFLAPAYVYDQRHVPLVARRLTQGDSRINQLIWNNMRSMNFNMKSSMKHFRKPVLIIHGNNDIVGTEIPRNAHEILPNSQLVLLENCRHYGWLDAEAAYFTAINNFLSAL